jgi:MFS family permease
MKPDQRSSIAGSSMTAASAIGITTCVMLPVFLTGALVLPMRDELTFDRSSLGLAVGLFFAASALGSSFLGRVAQLIGATRAIRVAALVSMVALLGIGLVVRDWLTLVMFLVLAGLANALAQPAANLALSQGVPLRRQGLAFGIKQSAIPVATLLAGIAVPVFAVALGWRWAFIAGAFMALGALIMVPTLDRPTKAVRGRLGIQRAARPTLLVLAISGALGAGASNAMGVFMVDAAVENGWGVSSAGILLSVGSIAALLVRLVSGWAIDRSQHMAQIGVAILMATGSVGLLLLAFVPEVPALYVLGTIIGFGAGWGWPGLLHFSVVHAHRDAAATATGFVQSGVFAGGVLGPAIFGYVVDGFSYTAAWGVGAAALLISAGGVARADRMHVRLSDI